MYVESAAVAAVVYLWGTPAAIVDLASGVVRVAAGSWQLDPVHVALLAALAERPGRPRSRRMLHERLFGGAGDPRAVDRAIAEARAALGGHAHNIVDVTPHAWALWTGPD
jgi:DNA-binding response OmpR family regulator